MTSIAMAPDGQSVIAGSQAGVAVYRWPDLTHQRNLKTSVLNVHDLVFSPDGKSIAVAGGVPSEQGVVEVLSWPSGDGSFKCDGHDDCVSAVAWQTDSRLATASLDHQVAVWNLGQSKPARRLEGHSRGVTAVCFLSGEPTTLLSGGLDQIVRVWNVDTGKLIRSLNNHTRPIHALAVYQSSARLPMLASASDDRTVRFWQPTIGRMVRFARLDSAPLAVDWSPDGSRVVIASADGHVRLIDPETAKVTGDLAAIDGWAYCVAAHRHDGSIAVGGRNGQLKRVLVSDSK